MPIKTLIHNLKLLGFDESRHGKGNIKLNEALFTHGAVNNDKALEYICVFLFRKVDRLRVKKELMPALAVHTYASRQQFINSVYKWLVEIRKKTDILNGVPLRKSELSAHQGTNVIKIMVAFSTYVLNSSMNHTDARKISNTPKAEFQNSIVQANQSFDLNAEASNTYVSKATEAAKEVSAELSSSPPAPSQNIIPVDSRSISRLNDHLDTLFDNMSPMLSNPANQDSNATEESFTSTLHEGSTIVERSSSQVSFEALRALEESSTSAFMEQSRAAEQPSSPAIPELETVIEAPSAVPTEQHSAVKESTNSGLMEQPRTPEQPSIPVVPEYSEAVNEAPHTVSVDQPLAAEELSTSVIRGHLNTASTSSSLLSTEQPTFLEEPARSVHIPSVIETVSYTAMFCAAAEASAAPRGTAGAPSFTYATAPSSTSELDSTEPEVPNINPSSGNGSRTNIYMPKGSRMITTPNYIPRSLTPDQQRNVPDAPRATVPNTIFPRRNTTFTPSNAIRHLPNPIPLAPSNATRHPPKPIPLAPMQLEYLAEANKLPPIRTILMAYSYSPSVESPFWQLPAMADAIHHDSPATPSTSAHLLSPPSSHKRKFDEQEEEEDIIVVPRSPPRQRRRLTNDYEQEGSTTPYMSEMELVPPLMDEVAPFRRIVNTEYFDIDLMTPRR
ncbi:hypothetical protein MBANPS3_010875 [Mucor bainieri]